MADKIPAGEMIYQRIKDRLKGKEGKIVAIDVESGDFFLGDNVVEASRAGRAKYPHKEFYFKRVGAKTAFVIGALHA
jgi:ABC-type sugar transport system substrate-binding protein